MTATLGVIPSEDFDGLAGRADRREEVSPAVVHRRVLEGVTARLLNGKAAARCSAHPSKRHRPAYADRLKTAFAQIGISSSTGPTSDGSPRYRDTRDIGEWMAIGTPFRRHNARNKTIKSQAPTPLAVGLSRAVVRCFPCGRRGGRRLGRTHDGLPAGAPWQGRP